MTSEQMGRDKAALRLRNRKAMMRHEGSKHLQLLGGTSCTKDQAKKLYMDFDNKWRN